VKSNGIKKSWDSGRPVLNGWLAVPSAFTAEIMAHQGWDSITIDLQHGMVDYQTAVAMLQALATTDVTALVRVPWLEPGIVMKCLDAGAYGIICPMVNTRAAAERLVSYLRYAPAGTRSFGPTRANFSAGPGYAAEADGQMICLAMIETREALDNLEEIASTPDLDGLYIGPADLSLALGYAPGFDREESEIAEVIQEICDVAHRHGKKAGLHNGTPGYAARAVKMGFDFVTISNDVRLLAAKAAEVVDAFRKETGSARADPGDATGGSTGY
jgi:4-hydroxy-2-oxoheptanedioate aldolase